MEEQREVSKLVSAAELIRLKSDSDVEQARSLITSIREAIYAMRAVRKTKVDQVRDAYLSAIAEMQEAVRPLEDALHSVSFLIDRYVAEQRESRKRAMEQAKRFPDLETAGNGAGR